MKKIQSLTMGCAVAGLMLTAATASAQTPLGSGFGCQDNRAAESDNDNETIRIGNELAAN